MVFWIDPCTATVVYLESEIGRCELWLYGGEIGTFLMESAIARDGPWAKLPVISVSGNLSAKSLCHAMR